MRYSSPDLTAQSANRNLSFEKMARNWQHWKVWRGENQFVFKGHSPFHLHVHVEHAHKAADSQIQDIVLADHSTHCDDPEPDTITFPPVAKPHQRS